MWKGVTEPTPPRQHLLLWLHSVLHTPGTFLPVGGHLLVPLPAQLLSAEGRLRDARLEVEEKKSIYICIWCRHYASIYSGGVDVYPLELGKGGGGQSLIKLT